MHMRGWGSSIVYNTLDDPIPYPPLTLEFKWVWSMDLKILDHGSRYMSVFGGSKQIIISVCFN
jgi:hypothetical protein